MAQRDPLIEYQREGFDMFNTMLDGLKEDCIMLLFRAQVAEPEQATQGALPQAGAAARIQQAAARASAAQAAQGQPTQRQAPVQPPAPPQDQIPPALRGGQTQSDQQYTYSGPSEGGGVQSRGSQGGNGQTPGGAGGGTRRERRAAARDAQKKGKGPRR
jgi:preprotein translocase subunit SecA